jgi:membrane protease YdiL (CAAX protease family)
LLATGIMVGLMPVFLWGQDWMMKHLQFGKWAAEMQETNDKTFAAFFKLTTVPDQILLLIILAVLPALGEEMLFRGVMLRLFHRRASRPIAAITVNDIEVMPDPQRSMVFPVIFTALLFAVIHFNPYGFVFIFVAACMLALIYYLTGSLLCSMWAHFLYNGIQVALSFFGQHNDTARTIVDTGQLPAALPIAGLAIFAVSFYALVRTQTPLPANWSLDYLPGEEPE